METAVTNWLFLQAPVVVVLFVGIWWLTKRYEKSEQSFDANTALLKQEHLKEIEKVEKRVTDLIDANNKLQEEKYQITREVIPLLIELIQKLNEDEQH